MKNLIIAIGLLALISCEPITGCGTVENHRVNNDLTLQLYVDFGDKTKWVSVDAETYLEFMDGDGICFD